MFFRQEVFAPVLFELLDRLCYQDSVLRFIKSKEALCNAVLEQCPEYAAWYNQMEMMGAGR